VRPCKRGTRVVPACAAHSTAYEAAKLRGRASPAGS
jgi:hypothetical protein